MPFHGPDLGIEPKIDPNSRLVSVRGEVDNPGGQLSPGQFMRVRVELPERERRHGAAADGAGDQPLRRLRLCRQTGAAPSRLKRASRPRRPSRPNGAAEKPQLVVAQVFVKAGRRAGLVEILRGWQPATRW